MLQYIDFILGEEVLNEVQKLNEGQQFEKPTIIKESPNLTITSSDIKLTKIQNDQIILCISNVEIKLTSLIDENMMEMLQTLIQFPPHLRIEIKSLSIFTSQEIHQEADLMQLITIARTNSIHRASAPLGQSYPSEDEWGLVFGCPFYQTFPAAKTLPVVVLKGEILISHKDKKVTKYYTYLLPLYIVFYESKKAIKASDSLFLTGAAIEIENPQTFKLTKSGNSFSFTFDKPETMSLWSKAILNVIHNAARSLDKWRRQ